MNLKIILLSFIFYCFGNISYAQYHPIPSNVLTDFSKQLSNKSSQQLKELLFKEFMFQKTNLIFHELVFRNDKDSKNLIIDYIIHLEEKSKNWDQSEGRIRSQKIYCLEFKAQAEVYLAKFNSGTFEAAFIESLDKLLESDPNTFLIDLIASKLARIGSEDAMIVLKKHRQLRPMVELSMFKVLTQTLSDYELSSFVFLSVQEKIATTDDHVLPFLVAERSIMAKRNDEDRMINIINEELDSPNWKVSLNANKKNYYLKYLAEQKEYFEERKERIKKESASQNHTSHQLKSPAKVRRKINSTLKVIRPEDKGEDFKTKSNSALLAYLESNSFHEIYENHSAYEVEIVNFRKVAKILGDRHLKGELILASNDQLIINRVVKEYLLMISSSDIKNFSEANQQIYRFWSLAIPVLLKELDKNKNFNSSAQLINQMKSEEVINLVIKKTMTTTNKDKKVKLYRLLKMMNNHYRIPKHHNRPALNKNEIEELYERLIIPALEKIKPQIE